MIASRQGRYQVGSRVVADFVEGLELDAAQDFRQEAARDRHQAMHIQTRRRVDADDVDRKARNIRP